jgi:Flp pilus assembly protein TadD
MAQGPAEHEHRGALLRFGSSVLFCLALFVAPLLAGTVHRPAITAVLLLTLVAVASTAAGEAVRGRFLRGGRDAHLFLFFVVAAVIQVVPLPIAWRGAIDPAGNELLSNGPHGLPTWWPASLDPRATLREVATAAAALGAFVLACHAGATGRRHLMVIKAIALSGAAGLVVAILHQLFDIRGLYGHFSDAGAILPAPFINSNHSAQLFELTAFCCLSLAIACRREARLAWGGVAVVTAAAAMVTLSRASVIALGAGGLTFFLLTRADGDASAPGASGRLGKPATWMLLTAGIVVTVAVALGAAPLFDQLSQTKLASSHEKPALWLDSLALVRHHPAGIGRHAFEHVYPAYKTLPLNLTFVFVENAPLQLLIDLGWLGFAGVMVSFALVIARLRRRRRADAAEAALLAGLAAVVIHNVFDFGLETLGLRLLFAAVAGIVIGRTETRSEPAVPDRRAGLVVAGTVLVTGCLGLVGVWKSTALEYVARWHKTPDREQRTQLMVEAATTSPTDYYLPVLQAADEPLRSAAGPSPRLSALNRALRLCPQCPDVHRETARALYLAGLRPQSVASWRDVLRLQPAALPEVLTEMDRRGYRPAEIADLAAAPWIDGMVIARYLLPRRAVSAIETLLADARTKGVPELELKLTSAELAVVMGDLKQAGRLADEARRLAPADGRPLAILAAAENAQGNQQQALSYARAATTLSPTEPRFARQWLDLVLTYRKWTDLDEALENLRSVFRRKGRDVAEVHVVAGQAHWTRGNLPRALSEFRTAVVLEPDNVSAWRALASGTEEEGDFAGALAALERVEALSPADAAAKRARERIARLRQSYETDQMLRPTGGQ